MTLPLLHMDLVGSILSIAGMWMISKKRWYGWAASAAANAVFIYINTVAHLWGMYPLCLISLFICIRSAVKWCNTPQL